MPDYVGFDVLELVVGGLKTGGMAADEYADVLLVCWFFVTDGVLAEDQVVMVAANDHGRLFRLGFPFGRAVVQHDVDADSTVGSVSPGDE